MDRLRRYTTRFAAALIGAALLGGLPANAAGRLSTQPVRLELSPAAMVLQGRGEQDRVFVTAILPDGSRRDVTGLAAFRAGGPQVAVTGGGVLTARRDGACRVSVSFGGGSAVLPVRVSGAAETRQVSFHYDVLPVLSRAGCNQGSCHGNSEGRGGFRLSLKGEDPIYDYGVIAHHGGGRRVNRTDPGASLLLLKATSALPHGGGQRFKPGSEEFRVLAGWIAQGAHLDPPFAPTLIRLDVLPAGRVAVEPARAQRLTVLGRFSDGSVRNLAERCVYSSSDPMVEVSSDGLVSAPHGGDASILVRYAGQMRSARLTFVPARKEFVWDSPPAYNRIDEINYRRLRTLRLRPSRLTTDAEFLRRAYLDAIGRLPTADEVRTFLSECSAEKDSHHGDTETRSEARSGRGRERSAVSSQQSALRKRELPPAGTRGAGRVPTEWVEGWGGRTQRPTPNAQRPTPNAQRPRPPDRPPAAATGVR